MIRIGRHVNTMCGQTAESFDVAEGGTTVLLNEFAFSQSRLFRVAMMPSRWRQQGVLRKGVNVTYQSHPQMDFREKRVSVMWLALKYLIRGFCDRILCYWR